MKEEGSEEGIEFEDAVERLQVMFPEEKKENIIQILIKSDYEMDKAVEVLMNKSESKSIGGPDISPVNASRQQPANIGAMEVDLEEEEEDQVQELLELKVTPEDSERARKLFYGEDYERIRELRSQGDSQQDIYQYNLKPNPSIQHYSLNGEESAEAVCNHCLGMNMKGSDVLRV